MWYLFALAGLLSLIVGLLLSIAIRRSTDNVYEFIDARLEEIEKRLDKLEKQRMPYLAIQSLEEATAYLNDLKLKAKIIYMQKEGDLKWLTEMLNVIDSIRVLVMDTRNGKFVKGA